MSDLDLMGDNGPPSAIDPLEERLRESRADLFRRLAQLEERTAEAPAEVTTEEEAQAVTALAAEFQRLERDFSKAHNEEKADYLAACRTVDAVLGPSGPQATTKRKKANLAARVTIFNDRKAAAERKRLADEAAKRRQEEEQARLDAMHAQARNDHYNAQQDETAAERAAQQAATAEKRATQVGGGITRTDDASTYTVDVAAYEVTDADQVRLELGAFAPYIARDAVEAALQRAANAKPPPIISGVRFFTRKETRVRAR